MKFKLKKDNLKKNPNSLTMLWFALCLQMIIKLAKTK